MQQNNVSYIRHWMLNYHPHLADHPQQEQILEILTVFAVILQKLAGCDNRDTFYQSIDTDGQKQAGVIGGKPLTGAKAEHILKIIAYDRGYLALDQLQKDIAYRYFYSEFLTDYNDPILLKAEFGDWGDTLLNRYRNCKFDRNVYVVNRKVFFADRELTESEIAFLSTITDRDQDLYDLDHQPDGSFHCW